MQLCVLVQLTGSTYVHAAPFLASAEPAHPVVVRPVAFLCEPTISSTRPLNRASNKAFSSYLAYASSTYPRVPGNAFSTRGARPRTEAPGITDIETAQGRKNRIFLLMEEVRRLRIQQRLKGGDESVEEPRNDRFNSALPLLPQLTEDNLQRYYTAYISIVALIILFGGLIAPILEVRLGLGGTSYMQFIQSIHLPSQLAQVDPIVASFCGGAVGVLSAFLLVEVKNVKAQIDTRCVYCGGTGYLECGNCHGSGCSECSMTGKVMCISCFCTGKAMATEHDPRADPFV